MAARAWDVDAPMRRAVDRMRWLRWGLALLASGCVPAVSPAEAEPRPAADDPRTPGDRARAPRDSAPAPAPDGLLEVELDGAAPRGVTPALLEIRSRDAVPRHAEPAAWSADGQIFAHCRALPGPPCTECRLLHRDGTTQSLESGPGCSDAAIPRATLDAHLAALDLRPPPTRWPIGANVVLVVETREAEQANDGQARAMLKLGARPRNRGPAGWLLHVDPCEGCGLDQACAAAAHFDALALSPQADVLAVLIHQSSPQGDELLRVELYDTERLAAAARGRPPPQ